MHLKEGSVTSMGLGKDRSNFGVQLHHWRVTLLYESHLTSLKLGNRCSQSTLVLWGSSTLGHVKRYEGYLVLRSTSAPSSQGLQKLRWRRSRLHPC